MTKFLTEETPGKVMSLLGVAMASMMFLFMATAFDVGFNGTAAQVPDPVSPGKLVSAIDRAANAYSVALHGYVIDSGARDYAVAAENLGWIASNAKDGALSMMGINPGDGSQPMQIAMVARAASEGRVAGAYTQVPYQQQTTFLSALKSALGLE